METNQRLLKRLYPGLFITTMLLSASATFAQVKVGDNPTAINPGSALEIESTNKGLLLPRVALASTTTWGLAGTAAAGMHVYNTSAGVTSTNLNYPILAAKTGEYYWDGTGWVAIQPARSFQGFGARSVSGIQPSPDAAHTVVQFTGEDWDIGNVFDPATGIFTVKQAGKYILTGSLISGNGAASSGQNAQIWKNNVSFVTGGNDSRVSPASPYGLVVTFVADLAVGDLLDLRATFFGSSNTILGANFSAALLY